MNTAHKTSAHVVCTTEDRILRIELHRPEKKNALTVAMYAALAEALSTAEQSADVRVVVIHGQPDFFTSGNDLSDFLAHPPDSDDHSGFHFLRRISKFAKPVVAAVTGPCVGVGATLLLHCDLVYAGTHSAFTLPFATLGICPEAGSSLLLPLYAGHARACELLLLGESFGAEEAMAAGLVSRIVPDAEVINYALAQARKLVTKPPGALRQTKALLRRGLATQIEASISEELRCIRAQLHSYESKEAILALIEKRSPDFARCE